MKFSYIRVPVRVRGSWRNGPDGALSMTVTEALPPEVTEETPDGKYTDPDIYEAFRITSDAAPTTVVGLEFSEVNAKDLVYLLNRATEAPKVDYAVVPFYRLVDTHVALGDDRQSVCIRGVEDAGKNIDGVDYRLAEAYQILDRKSRVVVTVFNKEEQLRVLQFMQQNFSIPLPKILKSQKHYAERDPEALLPEYEYHVEAMTAEGLHSKSDIAAELAYRDREINIRRAAHHQLLRQVIMTHPSSDMSIGRVFEVKGNPKTPEEYVALHVEQHGGLPSYQEVWQGAVQWAEQNILGDGGAAVNHMREGLRKFREKNPEQVDGYVPSDHVQPDSKD